MAGLYPYEKTKDKRQNAKDEIAPQGNADVRLSAFNCVYTLGTWQQGGCSMTTAAEKPIVEEAFTCTGCKCTTTMKQLLRPMKSDFSGMQLLCPKCLIRTQRRKHWQLMGITAAILLGLGIFGLFNGRPQTMNIVLAGFVSLVLLGPLVLIMHEMAHAVAGWLVGLRVFGIQLGCGKNRYRFFIGNFSISIQEFLSAGNCKWGVRKSSGIRWRVAVLALAGPMSHLAAIVPLLGWSLLEPRGFWPMLATQFVIVNGIWLVLNLWPRIVVQDGRPYQSDGLLVWTVLFRKLDPNVYILFRHAMEIETAIERHDAAKAREWFEKIEQLLPDSPGSWLYKVLICDLDQDWTKLAALLEPKLNEGEYATQYFARMWYCWAAARKGDLEMISRADKISENCMRTQPWDSEVQVIRGAVLAASGRIDEGAALLTKGSTHGRKIIRAYAACWLGRVYAGKGDQKSALEWLKRAEKLDRHCNMLPATRALCAMDLKGAA